MQFHVVKAPDYTAEDEHRLEQAISGLECHHPESLGRSKGVTVLLKPGEQINRALDVSVQPLNLQKIFVALCGEEAQ